MTRAPGGGGVNLGPAGQLRQDFPVHVQQVRIVVRQQNLWASVHRFLRQPLTLYQCKLKHEKPDVVSPDSVARIIPRWLQLRSFSRMQRASPAIRGFGVQAHLGPEARGTPEKGSNGTTSPVMRQRLWLPGLCRGRSSAQAADPVTRELLAATVA